MVKEIKLVLLTATTLILFSLPANAGGRHNQSTGFFLFDLFGAAPNSIYREPSPKVRGFRRSVGGYSYKYNDVIGGVGDLPTDFGPLYERGVFSPRLGINGPYIGD